MDRKAKIVATIGPSCGDETKLQKLVEAGLDVARLNFSHGTHEEHEQRIISIRKLSKALNRPITILQDLQGPKLRVGWLPDDGVVLSAGQIVELTNKQTSQADTPTTGLAGDEIIRLPIDIPDLTHNLSPGKRILLDDGHLELEIQSLNQGNIIAKVILGGKLTSHKGVNFPRGASGYPWVY